MALGVNKEPDYSGLLKATITYDYLHTNSTTHEFVFGAIAELVDNSRDAGAKNLYIDYDEGGLSFLDDGVGMVPDEAEKIVAFGYSLKRCEMGKVGRYGNGLKSGALRIGKDFIVFTKRAQFLTAMMLSRTFHEGKGIKDVIVPAPQFTDKFEPIAANMRKHEMEMSLIYEYSPFKTQEDIFKQFSKIKGDSGTLVVLYNLRRIETGEFEMDFKTDWSDIGLTDVPPEREPERNSLRAYLAILYMNPYTKIFLRGKRVNTVRILSTLGDAYTYTKECSFKGAKEKMIKEVQQERKAAEEDVKRTKSEYGGAINSVKALNDASPLEVTSKTRHHNLTMCSAADRLKTIKDREAELLKNKNKPYPAEFSFGMNIHHRNRYGCMIYNNGRLIEMYVKLPIQKESNDIYMKCLGVVGVVDLPYEVLEPTHNKQSFESKRDYQVVLRAFNDCMEQYWDDRIKIIGLGPQDIKRYWFPFGYNDPAWSAECSNAYDAKQKRYQKTNHVVQCYACLKWRTIEYQEVYVRNGIPDNWRCCDHPDSSKRDCNAPEHFGRLNPIKRKLRPKLKLPAMHASTSLAGQKPPPISSRSVPPGPMPFRSVPPRRLACMAARRRSPIRKVDEDEGSTDEDEQAAGEEAVPFRYEPPIRLACMAARRRSPIRKVDEDEGSTSEDEEAAGEDEESTGEEAESTDEEESPKTKPEPPKTKPEGRTTRSSVIISSSSMSKSPSKPTPANRPLRTVRKRTLDAKYTYDDSDDDEVPVKKTQMKVRNKKDTSVSDDDDDKDVVSSWKTRVIPRNGKFPSGPIPPRQAEAAEKKRKAEEEAQKKNGLSFSMRAKTVIPRRIEQKRPAQVHSDQDDDPSQTSSSRFSSNSSRRAIEIATKPEKEKFKTPSRRVISESEEDDVKEDSEEPIKKARTKADLRKQLDKSETLSPPHIIPDIPEDTTPTVKTSLSNEDIKTSPMSMKTNGTTSSDPQKEIEQLRKKLAETEAKLKESEKQKNEFGRNNQMLTQEAMLMRQEAVEFRATLSKLQTELHDASAWKGYLREFLKQINIFARSPDFDELLKARDGEWHGANWEKLAETAYLKMQKANKSLQHEVYPNEQDLVLDIEAVLYWVREAGAFTFSENLNAANQFRLFKELCDRVSSRQ